MFTGLIEATGTVAAVDPAPTGRRLRIDTTLGAELRPGDSIAVNGVCLTVTACDARGFEADLSPQTLQVTSFGRMTRGRHVNLERPLRADARLGGHFVLGHVDGVARVASVRDEGQTWWLEIDCPDSLAPLLVDRGSVAVDGVSLTVASLTSSRCGVQIIPFTWQHTGFPDLQPGDEVNIEADILGKYVARLLDTRGVTETT